MGYAVPGRPPQSTFNQVTTATTLTTISPCSLTQLAAQTYTDQAAPIVCTEGEASISTHASSRSKEAPNQECIIGDQAAIALVQFSPCHTPVPAARLDADIAGIGDDLLPLLPLVPRPAKPQLKPSTLTDTCFVLPGNKVFVDKVLPANTTVFTQNVDFPMEYFVALHVLVSSPTAQYPAYTPNYAGARIPLQHTNLKIERWRYHLVGYEGAEIVQFLQYGFPLGLSVNPPPTLVSALRNHGSSYQFYSYLDEFLSTGLDRCELAGPFVVPPFEDVHVSPLMTAVKKPDGRRAVFDATFGEHSLNNGTPTDEYMSEPLAYDFPKVEDFKRFVLESGKGCYIWKRDLSRYYLQLPVDPVEYPLLCFIWRKCMFFFCSLMFGLRHSGLQGQKVTSAVTWIHRRLGLETDIQNLFNSLNYSDDIGGCEKSLERATQSFVALGELLTELGLKESKAKAHPPSTSMPYLGIQFDTISMKMSIPAEKVAEVREEISLWLKKSSASKKSLQQLLGKLFWVSRCVRFSRGFMGRLLSQLQLLHALPDHKKVKLPTGCRQDIVWWDRYLRRFNGIEMLYQTDPLGLSLEQLLDTGACVNCGDAQMLGGGSYCGSEYWSRPFPDWLQDKAIPIHLKEFWVVLASAWLWGEQWQGKMVYVFCDNDAVVEVLEKERPKDPKMLELLQEFLYIVCSRKFTPIFRKIGTKENAVADYISRCHDHTLIANYFKSNNLPMRTPIVALDTLFTLRSNW